MYKKKFPYIFLLFFIGAVINILANLAASAATPLALKRTFEVTSDFGNRSDPWYWMRDDLRKNSTVLEYLKAENSYRDKIMEPLKPLEEKLFNEIIGRLNQNDSSVPERRNGYYYYTRYEIGREYPIYARRLSSMEAKEQILIDCNERAFGHKFYQLSSIEISKNGRWAAIAEDTVGRRQHVVRIKDLASGEILPDKIENVESELAWANDELTLLYIRKDAQTLLGNKIYRHYRGQNVSKDELVYEQDDESFYLSLEKSNSEKYIFIVAQSTVSTEYRYANADDASLKFNIAIPRELNHEYQLEDLGEKFIIRTNWKAKNFRIIEVPKLLLANRDSWRDIIPAKNDTFIAGFSLFNNFLAVSERIHGLQKIYIHSWSNGHGYLLDAPDSTYTMSLGSNTEADTPLLRYIYASPATPPTTYDYDMQSGKKIELKREVILGGFDSAHYVIEFRWAPARDGKRIPVSLLYRKGTKLDGTAPLYQNAYGAYGISSDPNFRSPIFSLVDRGFIYAIAHIRGGQELGRDWYEDGRRFNKKNSFTDFIDVTRFLVREKVADPNRVFGMGGSAGGLLIGAVANMAPQDYRGLIAHVPFVDVVTTMLDESIPLTTNEYDEWGNPSTDRNAYEYMLSYSPYDQVTAIKYPAMLITSGLWDSQVQYWEPAKWAAKLRALKTDTRPLLLHTNMEAGHGGKSGRLERYREIAEEYTFVLWQADMAQ